MNICHNKNATIKIEMHEIFVLIKYMAVWNVIYIALIWKILCDL